MSWRIRTCLLAGVALVFFAEPSLALAAGNPQAAGQSIENILLELARPLLLGLIGIGVIAGVFRHDHGHVLGLVALGFIAGVPIFVPHALGSMIQTIAGLVAGGHS